MSFYKQIAPYYKHIFKANVSQIDFLKSKITNPDSSIIDIGCGIGTLSFELATHYKKVVGIDMDSEMIRDASETANNVSKPISFQQGNMLELHAMVAKNSVDAVICFGNTLVHLNTLHEIADFLQQSKAVLKQNGKLLLQIVNYNKILSKNIKQLPLIENDIILFERHYEYRSTANKMDFNTRLIVKSTQQIIDNSIELLPVLKEELSLLLTQAGFKHQNYFGTFNQESYSGESPALIVEAW